MTLPCRVHLLGGVEISGSDAPVSSRAMSLLAFLVAHAGVPQPRGHLADVLWPHSGSAQARTNLRRELHHLRAAVDGTGCLEVTGVALTWHQGRGCVVDVHTFRERRARALAALENDVPEFVGQAQRALAEYRGDFLPGCYDDWALVVREELKVAFLELCDRATEAHDARGDLGSAIALQRRRVSQEPLDERAYRVLMGLQRRNGDRAGAMGTYHRCATMLEQELGVSPEKATRDELDLVRLEPGPPRAPMPSPVTASPGLVGRAAERDRLREEWAAARGGTAGRRLLLVTGEPGVGKTRLVAGLAADVRRDHGVAVRARCFAASRGLPLAPVAEWMRDETLRRGIARLDDVWRHEVARLVPDGASAADPVEVGRAKVDAWQRVRFFEGLARAVQAVDVPLLLVVDDLQWCDEATVSWLSFLVSLATSQRLLVVGTAREDELRADGPLAAMDAAGQVRTLRLAALSRQDSARLAQRVVGRPLSPAEADLVHSVTDGNPFYLIEALREAGATPGPVLPADLAGVLRARLSRLSPEARQVLELAAAVGRDFPLDLLAEASDLEPDVVVHAVDELWRKRVVEDRAGGYDVAHDLLREAAYDAIPPARRWLLHRRLAQALELQHPEHPELVAVELAEHYDRSGQPDRAARFYGLAARRAASVFAHAEAVGLWRRSRDLLEAAPAGMDRQRRELDIIAEMLPPLNAWQGYASAELESSERRLHELGSILERPEARATASVALFATTYVQGHIEEAYHWSEQALALAAEVPEVAGQAHMALAGSALALGRVVLSAEHFAQACRLAGTSDSLPLGTRTEVHARGWSAHALWMLGDEAGAAEATRRAVGLATALQHPYSLAVALAYAAVTEQLCGDLPALSTTIDRLAEVCDRYGFAYYREWATVLSGWQRGGEAGAAELLRGITALREEGALARMPYWFWLLADLRRHADDLAGASAALAEAEGMAVGNGDVWWLPEVLRMRAALGSAVAGRDTLDRAARLAEEHGSVVLLRRCRADLAR